MKSFELIEHLALLLALGLLYSFILRYRDMERRTGQVLAGLLFGGVAALGILNSYSVQGGILFDARSVILPMAGIFGGWPAALLSGVIATVTRIAIGGEGLITGIFTILLSVSAGILVRSYRNKLTFLTQPHGLLLTGFILHFLITVSMLTLPSPSREHFFGEFLPVYLIFYPLAFMLLAFILNLQERYNMAIHDLATSENKHQLLSDSAFEAVFIADETGFISQNKAAEKLFGYNIAELQGRNLSYLLRDRTTGSAPAWPEDAEGPAEMALITKNGVPVPAEVQIRRLIHGENSIRVFAVRDISQQKKVQEEFLHNESLFKEAERIAHTGHWEYDTVRQTIHLSDELCSIFESQPSSFKKFSGFVLGLTHPSDRRRIAKTYRIALQDGGFHMAENRLLLPGGKIKHVRQAFQCQLNGGKHTRSFGIIFDITDQVEAQEKARTAQLNLERLVDSRTMDLENSRKAAINLLLDANEQRVRAENALRQLEESHSEIQKLSQAVEQSLAAVAITNIKGEIEYVNHTFVEFTGYSKEEILGRKLNILSSPETTDEFFEQLWNTIRSGKSWKGEFHNRHKTGRNYWESVVISPIFNERHEIVHFVKVAQDISDRKKLEKDLIEARDKADQATRAKSEFLANVSHEIRTPMNAILGFADLLSYSLTDPRSLDYVTSLKLSGKNLLNLINDILDLSKVEAGMLTINMEYVNFRQLLQEIQQIFYFKIVEKGLKMETDIDGKFPIYIYTDETRLRQILLNLVSNAVKYTETGYVRIEAVAPAQKTGNRGMDHQETDIIIRVSDTGIGISESFQKVIFDSFTQEESHDRKKQGGTGLGLAISKNLVLLLGGQITVESNAGQGSTFTIHFRNVLTSDTQFTKMSQPALSWQDVNFEESTVLIIDDVEDNLKFLGEMLDYAGLKVITANNAEQAISILSYETPDLVITDIRMPGMDGFELLDYMKETEFLAAIPVIASSASVMNSPEVEEKLVRFDGYLLKPIQTSELIGNLIKFLPHRLAHREDINTSAEPTGTGKWEVHPRLMSILQEEAMPLWVQLKDRQPLKKVEKFAELLVSSGKTWDCPPLKSYGDELLHSRKSFNIEGMVALLRKFPELFENMVIPPSDWNIH